MFYYYLSIIVSPILNDVRWPWVSSKAPLNKMYYYYYYLFIIIVEHLAAWDPDIILLGVGGDVNRAKRRDLVAGNMTLNEC